MPSLMLPRRRAVSRQLAEARTGIDRSAVRFSSSARHKSPTDALISKPWGDIGAAQADDVTTGLPGNPATAEMAARNPRNRTKSKIERAA